jgi:hypothetical protein
MGKIKQVFRQQDNAARLKECSNELIRAQEIFAVHSFNLLLGNLSLIYSRFEPWVQHYPT